MSYCFAANVVQWNSIISSLLYFKPQLYFSTFAGFISNKNAEDCNIPYHKNTLFEAKIIFQMFLFCFSSSWQGSHWCWSLGKCQRCQKLQIQMKPKHKTKQMKPKQVKPKSKTKQLKQRSKRKTCLTNAWSVSRWWKDRNFAKANSLSFKLTN